LFFSFFFFQIWGTWWYLLWPSPSPWPSSSFTTWIRLSHLNHTLRSNVSPRFHQLSKTKLGHSPRSITKVPSPDCWRRWCWCHLYMSMMRFLNLLIVEVDDECTLMSLGVDDEGSLTCWLWRSMMRSAMTVCGAHYGGCLGLSLWPSLTSTSLACSALPNLGSDANCSSTRTHLVQLHTTSQIRDSHVL
jgi:hypothetical protein